MTRPTFVLRVRAELGVDAIRNLRQWLKRGLRDFGLRCEALHEEAEERGSVMAINLNNTPTQKNPPPIPPGVYQLRIEVRPGGAGNDGVLRRAKKNPQLLMLELQCEVLDEGEHKGRLIWDYVSVELDESDSLSPLKVETRRKLETAVRFGRVRVRAIIDSALRLDPDDCGAEAEKARTLENWAQIDGLVFWAQVDEQPGGNGYGPSNVIDFVVVPGDPAYPTATNGPTTTKAVAPRRRTLADDMDDAMPF
jgi:hypothetical protein